MKNKKICASLCLLLIFSTLSMPLRVSGVVQKRQELESGQLFGGAFEINNAFASGGKVVGNITKDATARLLVWADVVSTCTLKIQYMTAENRGARLFVNDLSVIDLFFNSTGSLDKSGVLEVNNVPLKKGWNSVDLKGGSKYSSSAPNLDFAVALIFPTYIKEGMNIKLNVLDKYMSDITAENFKRWISHLDAAYNSFYNLVGLRPNGGKKINIEVRAEKSGWAWVVGSGTSTIYWQVDGMRDELKMCNDDDNWSFGILHEMGHIFDLDDRWNFDDEFWANTKMYFVVEALRAKVYQDKYYIGNELKEYYRINSKNSYEKTLKNGIYSNDGLTYLFIRLKDSVGINPFKYTFRYFDVLPIENVPTSSIGKFNLFMTKLRDYSGRDVLTVFTPLEKQVIENKLGGKIVYFQ